MIATTLAAFLLIFLPHSGHGYSGQSLPITVTPQVQLHDPNWQIHWQLTHGELKLASGKTRVDKASSVITLQLPVVRRVTKMQWRYELYAPDPDSPDTLKLVGQDQTTLWVHPPASLPWARDFAASTTLTVIGSKDDAPLANWLTELGFKVRVASATDTLAIQKAQWLILEEGLHEQRTLQAVRLACDNGTRLLMVGQPSVTQQLRNGSPAEVTHSNRQVDRWDQQLGGEDVARPSASVTIKDKHPLLANFHDDWLAAWVYEHAIVVTRRTDVPSGGTSVVGWLHPDTQSLEADANAAKDANDETNKQPQLLDALVWTQKIGNGHAVFWRLNVSNWREDPRALLMLNNTMLYLMNPPSSIKGTSKTKSPSKETP